MGEDGEVEGKIGKARRVKSRKGDREGREGDVKVDHPRTSRSREEQASKRRTKLKACQPATSPTTHPAHSLPQERDANSPNHPSPRSPTP